MKKEDFQNSQQGSSSGENKNTDRNEQKNQAVDISDQQQNNFFRQAGLGRERMKDIEDLGGASGRDNYAGGDEDLQNENLNAANDQ